MEEQKNKKQRDEENERSRREEDNNGGEGMPRFSFMWIYILIGLVLLGLQMSKIMGSAQKAEWPQFTRWAQEGEIKRLLVVNDKEAYIYIVNDSLGFGEHKKIKADQKSNANQPPHYVMNIGKSENFERRLEKLNADLTKAKKPIIEIAYEDRVDWFSTLLPYLLTILLFAALWIFIVRRVGGGAGGPGGQIFNIGKSKATLFDNNSKVNITFADVAGLDEAKEEVMEIVDFLKNPKKIHFAGWKNPKRGAFGRPPRYR